MADEIMQAKDAAKALGLDRPYLYVLMDQGRLRAANDPHPLQTKRGRLTFWKRDIERLADEIKQMRQMRAAS